MEGISLEYCIILNTTSNIDEAKKIAYALVENKLAACVNIIPQITSIYGWKGDVWEDGENLLVIKTQKNNFEDIKVQINRLHSYELPEVIMLDIKDGSKNYLNWITKETLQP